MIKGRIDICLFKEAEGLKDEKVYFAGAKWLDIHDKEFIEAIEKACDFVDGKGSVSVRIVERLGDTDGEKKENG